MEKPILVQSIPPQIVNENTDFGPLDLTTFIQSADGDNQDLIFEAHLQSGEALPEDLNCTSEGILTGVLAANTEGEYQIVVTAQNEKGSFNTQFSLSVKPAVTIADMDYLNKLKNQIWEAFDKKLPVPELAKIYDRPITTFDIYYLLERWGTLTVWNAYDLEPPQEKKLLTIEGNSEHYHIYDCGSSIVGCPKDLFSHERTLEDGLKMARALSREVFKRGWTIEMAGFEKLTRAVWVEIQRLGDHHGNRIEIINYNPTDADMRLYSVRSQYTGQELGLD